MSPAPPTNWNADCTTPLATRCLNLATAWWVAPGIQWLRMGLPFALNHINLWLLRDTIDGVDGWTVVDCCIDKPESRAQWEQVFVNALGGLPILRVIVTHMHPDHIGLAHWLCERWQVPMWISATDYNVARMACLGPTAFGGPAAAEFFCGAWAGGYRVAGKTQRPHQLLPQPGARRTRQLSPP